MDRKIRKLRKIELLELLLEQEKEIDRLQAENAESPIVVTLSEITTEVSHTQFQKAPSSMVVTP